jgi:hypothetical protein
VDTAGYYEGVGGYGEGAAKRMVMIEDPAEEYHGDVCLAGSSEVAQEAEYDNDAAELCPAINQGNSRVAKTRGRRRCCLCLELRALRAPGAHYEQAPHSYVCPVKPWQRQAQLFKPETARSDMPGRRRAAYCRYGSSTRHRKSQGTLCIHPLVSILSGIHKSLIRQHRFAPS